MARPPRLPLRFAALTALMLAGCTVGPDYAGPPEILPQAETSFAHAGEVRTAPGTLQTRWWTALGDTELDRLEDAALAASSDVAAARSRLLQSRAGLREQQADILPTSGTDAIFLHASTGGNGFLGNGNDGQSSGGSSNDFNFYNVGFDASWEVDIFGGQRRAIESAGAAAGAREADLADTQVSLTAEVGQAYVSLRDFQNRSALAHRSAELQGHSLDLTRMRLQGGTASELDVERLNTEVESTLADLVPLQQEIEAEIDRLAVLTGRIPGALDGELAVPAPLPMPPPTVTVGDPASLLRRRPDIRVAERQVAAQNAVIGERVADFFPKVQLLGNLGFGSTDVGQLLSGGSFSALAAPIIQWSPFDFGRTQSRLDQANAAHDEALASYRGVVLRALGDAETALSRYGRQRESVASLTRVKASADRAARLTQDRYGGGTATIIDTLDTERQRLQAEQSLAQAQAGLTQDFISLQKSLGLGWSDG